MKKIVTVFCSLCLLLTFAPAAMAVNNLAEQAKNGTMDALDGIRESQAHQKKATDHLDEVLRQLHQAQAGDGAMDVLARIRKFQVQLKEAAGYLDEVCQLQAQAAESGNPVSELPEDLKAYMDANGLSYGGDRLDLDAAARSLQDYKEWIETDILCVLVYAQDYLRQYNSNAQGAGSTIQPDLGPPPRLPAFAFLVQSLFSTTGAANMDLPPIATSLLLGALLGMALMWGIQHRRPQGMQR